MLVHCVTLQTREIHVMLEEGTNKCKMRSRDDLRAVVVI